MNGAFPRSGLDRENHENPTGGGGVDDFISWVAADLQICSDDASPPQLLRNVRTMNRDRRYRKHVLAGVAFGTLTLGGPAAAADMTLKAPVYKTVYDWTGFYIGGHFGYGGGSLGPGTNPLPEQGVFLPHSATGLIGGFQVGYN